MDSIIPDMATNHALLLSIRPRYIESIFAGLKTVELRRVKPRVEVGDLVVVYASGGTKGIVGAFEVADLIAAAPSSIWRKFNGGTGLSKSEFDNYFTGAKVAYAIRVGKCWQLPQPVQLETLRKRRGGFRPPQSYHYWKEEELAAIGGIWFSQQIEKRKHEQARPHRQIPAHR